MPCRPCSKTRTTRLDSYAGISKIELPREQLEEFCRCWKIVELSLFGSVLRDDFQPESDIDVLVSFAPDARRTLFDLVRIEDELADILGRKVDLVERDAVENRYFREVLELTQRELYAA